MKYTSEFYSIDSKLYKIEIDVTTKSGSDKTFKLSDNPFVASISNDDKHIYSPIRCGGATVGILTDSFISDFYNGQAKGVKVTLYNESNNNSVEWVGYVTPSVYTQGFDKYYEELQLDCVDGIAVLKDIPYVPLDSTVNKFSNIIFHCLKQSNCYSNFYITDNVQFTQNGTESIIEKLRISESNFSDEKDDPNQTDDDVAWSCYEVLYQTLQYLGYTLVIEGNEVYIVDYDAIKSGNNKYFRYSLNGNSIGSPTSVNVSYSKYIDGDAYSKNGTSLEMTEIYNKVTVKDEFTLFDSLFPHYDDINYQTNITPSTDTISFIRGGTDAYMFSDILYEEKNGKRDYYYIIINKGWYATRAIILRFYDNAIFEMKRYTSSSATISDVSNDSRWDNQCKFSDMLKYNGGYYYRMWKKEIKESDAKTWISKYNKSWTIAQKLKAWQELTNENTFELTPYTVFMNRGDGRIPPGNGVNFNDKQRTGTNDSNYVYTPSYSTRFPFMKLKETMANKVFGGDGAQIRITGKYYYHDEDYLPHFIYGNCKENKHLSRGEDTKDNDEGFFWAKLKWGPNYWNGKTWTTTQSYFQIYYWTTKISRDNRKNKRHWDKWLDFTDKDADWGVAKEIIIPCPSGYNLYGDVEMELYIRDMNGDSRRSHWHPDGTKTDNRYNRYFTKVAILKDFDVIPEIVNDIVDDGAGETDTIYTNVITNGSVNKMDEITFKVCTDDNKKPNFSSVDYLDGSGKSQYVKSLYNKALYNKERTSVGCDGNYGALRQEEHYIFKLATQYENPMLMLECNLHNEGHKMYGTYTDKTLSGKTFILNEREIDYKYNTVCLKVTEKF